MEIEATFIGENSLGYETGKTYRLYVSEFRHIAINRTDKEKTGFCHYSSIITFLKNWSNIKRV